MKNNLYPLKFKPIFKEKIWGGNRLKTALNKSIESDNIGESWEISSVEENISVVENGFLAGNNLQELIEIYMGDLVGEKNYKKFGLEFPLLIKFIDAQQDLSVQVHPNDEMAKKRHNAYGKTEMWYVVDADENAKINSGFNQKVNKEQYIDKLNSGNLIDILQFDKTNAGDVYFIPAGRIHAIGAGVLVAEIQQTSDVTYRVYDYDRKDQKGNKRELHNDLAIDAINFEYQENYKTQYKENKNEPVELVSSNYFTTNLIDFDKTLERDFYQHDTFVIYMCIDGSCIVEANDVETTKIDKGETVLIPASIYNYKITPTSNSARLLEVYIKNQK